MKYLLYAMLALSKWFEPNPIGAKLEQLKTILPLLGSASL
jgi:hypothetical protein